MINISKNIDKAFVISIDEERRERFYQDLAAVNFPSDVELFQGIVEDKPLWYPKSKGFWGCLRSHVALLKKLRDSDWNNILIFEDDAKFCVDFEEKFSKIEIPDNWDWFYLGGKPIKKACVINDKIIRCNNVNLAHAYMVSKRNIGTICWFMENMWEHYSGESYKYMINDWKYGELHGFTNAYLCLPNLVSQYPGISSTENKYYAERKF